LIGFLLLGTYQMSISKSLAGVLASLTVFGNLIISAILFFALASGTSIIKVEIFDWIRFAEMSIPCELVVDRLTALMLLIINGVGLLIHIYSIGYMKTDKGATRFFAYLNLFVFFMLILVLSANYLMLFIGWEGVGLSSYLLIGFWYGNHANNDAAKKSIYYQSHRRFGLNNGNDITIHAFSNSEYQ